MKLEFETPQAEVWQPAWPYALGPSSGGMTDGGEGGGDETPYG